MLLFIFYVLQKKNISITDITEQYNKKFKKKTYRKITIFFMFIYLCLFILHIFFVAIFGVYERPKYMQA